MKLLVANLGSTSYKYRLFSLAEKTETMLAEGGYERVTDYATVISDSLQRLIQDGHLERLEDLDGVGFKTVMGGEVTGCISADDALEALEATADLAPAHNPAYASGIRQFRKLLPEVPLVALFETAYYQWAHPATRRYAVPQRWFEAGVRRYGFHGASHKFMAERTAQLLGRDDVAARVKTLYHGEMLPVAEPSLRVVSCHLGGSSSLAGIRDGLGMDASMGLSPQSGLPQSNRVGDLDSMAIPLMMRRQGMDVETAVKELSSQSGLSGMSGIGADMRDIRAAATEGNANAQLAIEHYVEQIRHWLGSLHLRLNGLDAIAFTGGIGENDHSLRALVCKNLENLGIRIDPQANNDGERERAIHSVDSAVKIFIIPANEELVVARETFQFIQARTPADAATH